MSERIKRAKRMNRIMTAVFYAVAVFFLILLAAFAGKVIIGGLIGAKPEMFGFDRQGCIGNQLFNTVYLVLVALVCSVPVGVFAGICLAIYAKQGILTRFLRICIETLSSLPSIVVGLFGYLVFLVFMGMGKSLLAGALSVSILTLPSGSTLRWGNWDFTSPTSPLNLLRPAETLSTQIWNLQINGQDRALADLASAVLLLLVLVFNIAANAWSRKIEAKNSGEKAGVKVRRFRHIPRSERTRRPDPGSGAHGRGALHPASAPAAAGGV